MARLAEIASIGASTIAMIVGALRLAAWKAQNPGKSIRDALSGFLRPDPNDPTDIQRKDSK